MSDARLMTYMLTDPKGKKVHNVTNNANFEYLLTATQPGNYQLCITNGHKVNTTVNFAIESGAHNIDYTNIVEKKHLKPVELQSQKILDMIEQIRTELGNLVVGEERIKESNSKIKFRVVVFGILSVVVMGVTTYLQVAYLKKFFRSKKII